MRDATASLQVKQAEIDRLKSELAAISEFAAVEALQLQDISEENTDLQQKLSTARERAKSLIAENSELKDELHSLLMSGSADLHSI